MTGKEEKNKVKQRPLCGGGMEEGITTLPFLIKDKSTVARELIREGWNFLMIRQYRQGKLSLGTLAERLDLSLSETIDVLSDLGIQAPIEYEDYLKGLAVFRDADTRL